MRTAGRLMLMAVLALVLVGSIALANYHWPLVVAYAIAALFAIVALAVIGELALTERDRDLWKRRATEYAQRVRAEWEWEIDD